MREPQPSTVLPEGDDETTGAFVLQVDSFTRATYGPDGSVSEYVHFARGERLHLSEADAVRLLGTDPPAVRRFGDPEPVPALMGGAGWTNGRV